MSKLSKRNRVLVALALLVVAFAVWRLTRPPLSNEQQIRANMNDLVQGMQKTAPRQMLQYLAPDFKWNNNSRDQMERLVRQVSAGATHVEVTRTGENLQMRGEEATVSGNYTIYYQTLQEPRDTPPHVLSGQYTVLWQKRDGDWKIVALQGGEKNSSSAPDTEPLF